MKKILFLLFTIFLLSVSTSSASEAIIYYGALNGEENHSQVYQELSTAITEGGFPLLASFGKQGLYPPNYYYWRFIVDTTNLEKEFLQFQNLYHNKDLLGFVVQARHVESYLIGHMLTGRSKDGNIIIRANNFDLQTFSTLSETHNYASEKSDLFKNDFLGGFLDYLASEDASLAQAFNDNKNILHEVIFAHAITINATEGEKVSYRVLKFSKIF